MRIQRFPEQDLTVVRAAGTLAGDEVAGVIRSFYSEPGHKPTTYAFWDLREASLEKITDWDAVWISQVAEHSLQSRNNGKTAIVVASDFDYGISRMITGWNYCLPVDIRTFMSIKEAADWLGLDVSAV